MIVMDKKEFTCQLVIAYKMYVQMLRQKVFLLNGKDIT